MGSLIVSEHDFERKWRQFERIVWLGLVAILAAGTTGALGRGGVATRTAVSPDGAISVTYDRVLRARSSADLEVIVESSATRTGEARVDISSPIAIRQMSPPPVDARAMRGGSGFVFRAEPSMPARVRLVQAPETPGRYRTTVGSVTIEQIVLP